MTLFDYNFMFVRIKYAHAFSLPIAHRLNCSMEMAHVHQPMLDVKHLPTVSSITSGRIFVSNIFLIKHAWIRRL